MLRRPAPPLTLAILIFACIGLVSWHYATRRGGRISLPQSGAFLVLRPAQRVLKSTGDWFSDVAQTMFRRGGIIAENETLRAQLADLRAQNQRMTRYQLENRELRQLLKMPKPYGGAIVPAEIVSLNFTDYAQRVVVNVNERQGVRPKDVVFAAQGVVGQVVAANRKWEFPPSAEVLLLTDRQSSIGAMTARTAAKGVVQGTGERICKMSYLNFQADVREGDLVLTSGESTIFPRGMVIGRVLKVEKDKTYSRLSAYIDPAVPLDQISAVYVRTKAGP